MGRPPSKSVAGRFSFSAQERTFAQLQDATAEKVVMGKRSIRKMGQAGQQEGPGRAYAQWVPTPGPQRSAVKRSTISMTFGIASANSEHNGCTYLGHGLCPRAQSHGLFDCHIVVWVRLTSFPMSLETTCVVQGGCQVKYRITKH
jgi:hypothetical protein